MPQPIHLKDHEKDARLVRRRVIVGAVAVVLLTLVLVARMYHLQVTQYEYHSTLSENNRVHVQPIPPTRGIIFDRNGVIIADNRPSFSLTITRERTEDLQKTPRHAGGDPRPDRGRPGHLREAHEAGAASVRAGSHHVRTQRGTDRPHRGEPVPPAGRRRGDPVRPPLPAEGALRPFGRVRRADQRAGTEEPRPDQLQRHPPYRQDRHRALL